MKQETIAAIIVGGSSFLLFTTLLIFQYISEGIFFGLIVASIVAFLAIAFGPRVLKLSLRDGSLELAKIEEIEKRITSLYGNIEHLKRSPFVLDNKKMNELGLGSGHLPTSSAVMRYTSGCIKRERERIAQIAVTDEKLEKIAQAILDPTFDELVFKWNGPETPLHTSPVSTEYRETKKNSQSDSD